MKYHLIWIKLIILVLINIQQFECIPPVTTQPPPASLKTPIRTVAGRILMTGGPTNIYPEVQEALMLPLISHLDPLTFDIIEDIKAGIRYMFQTKNEWTLALSAGGNTGIETILQNLLEPGDVILVPVYGMWGDRVAEMAKRIGAIVKTIEKPLGSACNLDEFEEAVKMHKPNLLYIVHGESSTGVVQNLTGLGDLCRKYDCLLAVDTVATILTEPFLFDEWKVDAAFCNTQKGLGSSAGLAPITFGPRAVAKMQNRKTPVISYIFDVIKLTEYYWGRGANYTSLKIFHHSTPVIQLYALRKALEMVAKETLEKLWERHLAASERFNKGLKALGLEQYVPEGKNRLLSTVTIKVPACVGHVRELIKYSIDKDNIEFGSGLGPTLGKILRIGIFGINANIGQVENALRSINETLQHFKTIKKLQR